MRLLKKALVIGIDEYEEAPLHGCVQDAIAVSELLKTNGDGSPNFDVRQKLNIKKKSDLMRDISQLFSGNAEVALLYFSGHGSDKDSGYLVTSDYNYDDLGVSMSYVLEKANQSKCKNKIIILDSCYSGKIGEIGTIQSKESLLGEGITIMTASSRNEVAVEEGEGGLFTTLFLQGLRGSAADITGRITPAGIYAFIDQTLGAWEQRPMFKTNTNQFFSLRDIEPRVSKETLRKLQNYFPSSSSEFPLDPSYEDTNNPKVEHDYIKPYAEASNVLKFKELQQFQSVGLVEPVGEDYMYFAAMKSKSCKLTALGLHYWKLARDDRF